MSPARARHIEIIDCFVRDKSLLYNTIKGNSVIFVSDVPDLISGEIFGLGIRNIDSLSMVNPDRGRGRGGFRGRSRGRGGRGGKSHHHNSGWVIFSFRLHLSRIKSVS